MTPPVKPEDIVTPPGSQIPPQELPPAQVPTNNGVTEERFNALMNMVAQQNAAFEELKSKFSSASTSAEPPHDPAKDAQIMFQDPRTLIREEVTRAVEPLNQFRVQMQRQNNYSALKSQLRSAQPQLNPYWAQIESQLDAAFAGGQVEPTPQSIMFAVNAIVGNIALSGGFNQQQKPPNNSMVPPNIPSSPPPPPTPKPQLRELTEAEHTVRRAAGLTVEQYLANVEGSSISVPVTKPGGTK